MSSSSDSDVLELRRIVLAEAFAREHKWEEALAEVEPSRQSSSAMVRRWAESMAARAYLALGELTRASVALDRAFAQSPIHSSPDRESALWLTRAEVLDALGNRMEARSVLREARDRIFETASAFEDDAVRSAFMSLESIAGVVSLASEWLSEPSTP